MRVVAGVVMVTAVVAGCDDKRPEAQDPAPQAGAQSAAFLADVDRICKKTQDAARAGPRFPYRTFDPSNPDRRLRAVGRFYRRLDTERTLSRLVTKLRRFTPDAGQGRAFQRLVAELERLIIVTRAQTKAALSGSRSNMIATTADLETMIHRQHDSAADFNAFSCALSLERNPKTLF